jgi:hypothetical protein
MRYQAIVLLAASVLAAGCSQRGASTAPSTTAPAAANSASGGSTVPMTEGEARQRLAERGFSEVTSLKQEADGSWIGTGMFNGKQRTFTVTPGRPINVQ